MRIICARVKFSRISFNGYCDDREREMIDEELFSKVLIFTYRYFVEIIRSNFSETLENYFSRVIICKWTNFRAHFNVR